MSTIEMPDFDLIAICDIDKLFEAGVLTIQPSENKDPGCVYYNPKVLQHFKSEGSLYDHVKY